MQRLLGTLVAILVMSCSGLAAAQTWPAKPVKFIVPFAAGGSTDVMARFFADKLSVALGQSFIVDNRTGAGGIIGTDLGAKAPPDGYTFLFSISSTLTTNPYIVKSMPYDPVKDLKPVLQLGYSSLVVAVPAESKYKTFAELLAAAKADTKGIPYGTWSIGSTAHLAMAMAVDRLGVHLEHVPYKGVAPLTQDFISNQIPIGLFDLGSIDPHIKSGKARPLAVFGESRSPFLPDVPTLVESGIPFDITGWWGILAPAGTPDAIVERLNAEMQKLMATPEGQERLRTYFVRPAPGKPSDIPAVIAKELKIIGEIVKVAGIKPE